MMYNSQAPRGKPKERKRSLDRIVPWKLNNMKFRALKSAEISLITLWKQSNSKSKKKLEKSSEKGFSLPSGKIRYNFFREFDPGSGLTLAACITHSSRTVKSLRGRISGGRVSNAWATCPCVRDTVWKRTLIPYDPIVWHHTVGTGLLHKDGLASD